MKKYTFQMTKKEVRELCLRMIWEFMLLNRFKSLLILMIFVLECIALWEITPFAIVFAPLSIAVLLERNYSGLAKQICGKTRSVWAEDGMLKYEREGDLTIEITCDSITEVRTTSHLLMLGRYQAPKVIGWCLIPLRVFTDEKERKEFIESVRNPEEQTESLKELCREKQVEINAGKRKKYVPKGIFPAMVFIAIMGCMLLSAWLAFRNSRDDISNDYIPYGYIPYDYITYNYVSFEEQVSVLRSLGFSISEELEESWRGYMEDEETAVYIEEYPYTDLLIALSWAGDNGEDGAKVFWFDFEGWDISTDYIRVLEGMRELASGSVLDDVRNIREDIEDVDWENGMGTITVSLEWKGQEYSWEMAMNDDWIDGKVVGLYNGLLEKEGIPERFYVTVDNGQDALVFYCTGEWALEFERATGMELEADIVRIGW